MKKTALIFAFLLLACLHTTAQNIANDVAELTSYVTAVNDNLLVNPTIHLKPSVNYVLTTTLVINNSCTIDGHGATLSTSTGSTRLMSMNSANTSTVAIRNLHLTGSNLTGGEGSAILAQGTNLELQGCEINGCATGNTDGTVTFLSTLPRSLTVTDCYIHNNTGCGISTNGSENASISINNSTFANNTGNGVKITNGNTATKSISNCTFFNNSPLVSSGNIYFQHVTPSMTLNVNHCTIYGGVFSIEANNSTISCTNTILAQPTGVSIASLVSGGVFMNTSSNVVNPNPSTALTGLSIILANNGGFAPTLSIDLTCTAALNQGNTSTGSDQRGGQASGIRDIGAYEFNGTLPFVVTNTNAFGAGSLHAAINNANKSTTSPTITFNIPTTDIGYQAATSHWQIRPINGTAGNWSNFIKDITPLPTLTKASTTINGGATTNSAAIMNANTALLKIELNGELSGTSNGLTINAANCTIADLNINKFSGIGIRIEAIGNNAVVRGCFIGTDIRGLATLYGNTADGIFVNNASDITIGGNQPASQNIISGNGGVGIAITGGIRHIVQGNTVGLNASKTGPIGNGLYGVAVVNSNATIVGDATNIGGTAAGTADANLISGNTSNGIFIESCKYINVYKNYIGIKGDGSLQINTSEGIRILGNSSKINIGNGAVEGRNVIGGQLSNIVLFHNGSVGPNNINITGNYIGLGIDGVASLGGGRGIEMIGSFTKNIYISQNSIACNVVKGISLSTSANENVLPPTITQATTASVTGTANALADVEVYADVTACTPKQGSVYLGPATANALGVWTLSMDLSSRQGQYITAIQHAGTLNKNTSEFSTAVLITNSLPTSANIELGIAPAPLVLEDVVYDLNSSFVFNDLDIADTFWGVRIEVLPANNSGNLRYVNASGNTVDVSAGTNYKLSATGSTERLVYTTNANGNSAPPVTFVFYVIDSKTPSGVSALAYTATVQVTAVNDAPTIDAVLTPNPISFNSAPAVVTLSGIGKGGGADEASQTFVTFTATSNNLQLIANPVVNYTQGAATATLTYSVLQAVSVSTNITITVTLKDDGGIANGGIDQTTTTFVVTVVPNTNAPYDLQANVVSATSIRLDWLNDTPNTTAFQVYRAIGSTTTNYTLLATTANGNTFTYTDTGLAQNEFYAYKVRSVSSVGFSEYSNISGKSTVNVSNAPTNLVAFAHPNPTIRVDSLNKVFLSWTDNSSDEAGFKLERYSIFTGVFLQIADLPANTTAYIDSDLLPNVSYQYKIRSYNFNSQNSIYSNIAISTTPINKSLALPNPPTNLDATSVSTQQINLRWEYNTNPNVIYLIERSPINATSYQQIAEYVSTDLTSIKNYIDINGLIAGTLYYYRVRARTGGGTSAASLQDTASARCNLKDLAIVRIDNGKEVICQNKSAAMSVVSKVFGASYQWKRNGVNVQGAIFETFHASETGVYTCNIAALAGGCNAISVNGLFVAVLNAPDALTIFEQNNKLSASVNDADSYQWFYDYQPISGATLRNYTPTKTGAYHVVATVESCTSTSPIYFWGILANERESISQYIELAPNPTRETAHIKVSLPTMGNYTLRLLDTKGKTIQSQQGNKNMIELKTTLPVNALPAGLYVVEIMIGNRKGYKKLIIQ